MSDLIIVESPTKVKTIKKYLGSGYEVVSSKGHIRDLPKSKMSIDFKKNFEPKYVDMPGKEDVIKELKSYAKKCDKVYLATDPDREGEAISWHIAQILDLDLDDDNRVTFNEITQSGIKNGMSNPRKLDIDLVNAQQARRILDRIVGYKLSPFLWKKVRRGLSAGRVQSVAVRLVVDREIERNNFVSEEYWTIEAKLTAPSSRKQFDAKFYGKNNEKLEIKSKEESDAVLSALENEKFIVGNVKKGTARKSPAPPFITSTLQQEASIRLGFQVKRTMRIAQELYEGVDVEGMGAVGLITYMRTDSLRVSDEAALAAEKYILETYGKQYLPPSRRVYKTKKNVQDAHEAIRPSLPDLTPERVKSSLSAEQYKLYKLIWERFIASQMANAVHNTTSADINAGEYLFRASGYAVKFDGFTALYEAAVDGETKEKNFLPELESGDICKVKSIGGNQHFTQPPPRYTEHSLVKAMEENGIGRPSTYAPTISTIVSRMYVEREGKALKPTALGDVTTQLMKDHFKHIVDAKFTAKMEKDLDSVENGDMEWVDALKVFYDDFEKTLKKAETDLDGVRVKVPDEETDEKCELCGKNLVIKIGRFGKFLACPGFPECKFTKKIVHQAEGSCPVCGKKLLLKKSKKGRSFYGCEGYPECNFLSWYTPTAEKCPRCGKTLFKKGGKSGKLICETAECGFERPLNSND
ncbi:MAG: type I DNA topoisomerase [Oscillospiraceae bacterium]|nr:type I DNA topoisomerase [Oscillospiraceae bacterium]